MSKEVNPFDRIRSVILARRSMGFIAVIPRINVCGVLNEKTLITLHNYVFTLFTKFKIYKMCLGSREGRLHRAASAATSAATSASSAPPAGHSARARPAAAWSRCIASTRSSATDTSCALECHYGHSRFFSTACIVIVNV